ncbi:MAG TPA: response regulator [Verrucomicrobiae bacterium]
MQAESNNAIRPLVYIVDDEPMIGELVGSFLRMEGMDVEVFSQPKVALAAFQAANPKPSLLLTDFQMPEMSGLELIAACRNLHPSLKTISISGTMTTEDMESSGIKPDRFVRKPFMPSDLRKPMAELLGMELVH